MKRSPIDPELLRDRLAGEQGKRYWRSLEELAGDPRVAEMLQREFPNDASRLTDPVSRRRFLMLMGAGLALAGGAGCRAPAGLIMPHVRNPENQVLGKPLYYATAMPLAGYATGLLVESHEGRPTKIEGNDKHPASLGATSAIHQASILGLYDPDRSQNVSFRGTPRSWGDLIDTLRRRLKPGDGTGLAVLTDTVGSPTLDAQLRAFQAAYPKARLFHHEPVHSDNAHKGATLAFGRALNCYANLELADCIVSLGADFLGEGPAHLVYNRQFAKRRRQPIGDPKAKVGGERGMNRLYIVETDLTITGAAADHRLAVRPSRIEAIARGLAARLGVAVEAPTLDEDTAHWVDVLAKDLQDRGKGATAVLVGDGQPDTVHALAHAINAHLGNAGRTILYTESLLPGRSPAMASLTEFEKALGSDEIDTLLVVGSNPAYSAPADLPIARLLAEQLNTPAAKRKSKKDWLAVHMGLYFDETARLCNWHIPQAHFLEQWSDAVAFDGTVSIVQPLIAPLYEGRSPHELFAALTPRRAGDSKEADYDSRDPMALVRDQWKKLSDKEWATALHDGVIAGTVADTGVPDLDDGLIAKLKAAPPDAPLKGYELAFAADPGVFDGRFANNGWLQEWPRPVTRLTWDNAVMMSRATAEKLGVAQRYRNDKSGGEHGEQVTDVVRIRHGKYQLDAAAWIVPGHADDALTLHLGYGRTRAGKVGTGAGFDAYKLRLSNASWFVPVDVPTKQPRRYSMACTQGHWSMEGRDPVRSGTLGAYEKDPKFATKHDHAHGDRSKPLTLYKPPFEYTGYKWGMAIDLSACTGCGSCVVACQAENNSPVVGKLEVTRGREIHWLRIDRYFATPKDEPNGPLNVHFQPMLCQHCEQAPCELVCPVEATAHSDEGLNDMVYNRCVGTRYCANNCPYKVRRFNFLQYADFDTPSLKLLNNPDVTVRTRGVMEKCTFCVQRISYARIEAAKEAMDELDLPADAKRHRKDDNGPDGEPRRHDGREVPLIHDGEVVTACQAACPAEAIVFGDLNDKRSRVHKLHESNLHYGVLSELGTRPRIAYLAELRNPNPAMEGK